MDADIWFYLGIRKCFIDCLDFLAKSEKNVRMAVKYPIIDINKKIKKRDKQNPENNIRPFITENLEYSIKKDGIDWSPFTKKQSQIALQILTDHHVIFKHTPYNSHHCSVYC